MSENIIDDPEYQGLLKDAMKIMDMGAQESGDNRIEMQYVRNGVPMRIVCEGLKDNDNVEHKE